MRTGQTSLHEPHRLEANGRVQYRPVFRDGASTEPIGPGTV